MRPSSVAVTKNDKASTVDQDLDGGELKAEDLYPARRRMIFQDWLQR